MDNQINYCLPGFFTGFRIYQFLLSLYKNNKNVFYDNINFYKIFDSFPNCIWNGGTINFGIQPTYSEMKEIINFYNSNNIGLQFTATNPLLTEKDCYDRYGNTIIKLFISNPLNEILVSSDILESYLRDTYQNIKISRSIIATKNDVNYNNLIDKYEHIVLPKRYINNFNQLNTIFLQNRSKMELLCNDPCPINCSRLYDHYNEFANLTLFNETNEEKLQCFNKFLNNPLYQIQYNDIQYYLKQGFNLFKISGRDNEFEIIKSIIPYLIKIEYQFKVSCDLFLFLNNENF